MSDDDVGHHTKFLEKAFLKLKNPFWASAGFQSVSIVLKVIQIG